VEYEIQDIVPSGSALNLRPPAPRRGNRQRRRRAAIERFQQKQPLVFDSSGSFTAAAERRIPVVAPWRIRNPLRQWRRGCQSRSIVEKFV